MGDAYEYPEIRMARFQYAMRWLPPNVRVDYGLRISDWLSGIAEAFGVALWLTMLPCAGSRGRFGDDGIPMTVCVVRLRGRRSGARGSGLSAGVRSMLIQK